MILLTLGQTEEKIVVTLNEKRTLDDGYYLFQFTHIETRNVINKIYAFAEDESDFQDRYNQFEIDTSAVFLNQPPGDWVYKVYEQESDTNTNTTGLTMVERGIMTLKPSSVFAFTKYNEATSFKTYGG